MHKMEYIAATASTLTIVFSLITTILLWNLYHENENEDFLASAILSTGMFIVPMLSTRLRRSDNACVSMFSEAIFVLYGFSVLAVVSYTAGRHSEQNDALTSAVLFALASVCGHFMKSWDETKLQRTQSNTRYQNDKNAYSRDLKSSMYFSYVSIASLIVALVAQIVIITDLEKAHLILLTLAALLLISMKSFDLGVEVLNDFPWSLQEKSFPFALINVTINVFLAFSSFLFTPKTGDDTLAIIFTVCVSINVVCQHYII